MHPPSRAQSLEVILHPPPPPRSLNLSLVLHRLGPLHLLALPPICPPVATVWPSPPISLDPTILGMFLLQGGGLACPWLPSNAHHCSPGREQIPTQSDT